MSGPRQSVVSLPSWPIGGSRGLQNPGASGGFTLIELLIVVVILGILATLAIPQLQRARERALIARAIGDINAIEVDAYTFEAGEGRFPDDLSEIDRDGLLDPWGNPYQFVRIAGPGGASIGKLRKDQFNVPINSDFDLYSMGPDGKSTPPLTANAARDDIVRANDGGFCGLASDY